VLGEPRVNVLALNLALDEESGRPAGASSAPGPISQGDTTN
jgi:hypothetical protein